ncbi:MAG: hypothetical protein M2R45_02914 [Verrucomicrobia subdivision 3 bacterium]|nr:hypothetical protein [Limisphaerales bacterium]MCS1415364.1 hypothetical protein [Limisphaerales bacterium]
MPFLQNFDSLVCEDTRLIRRNSTTPVLGRYNGDLVNEESVCFAKRIQQRAGNDPETRVR